MPAPVWRSKVTYVAAEPGWWADTVRQHFREWDEAVPLVAELGLPRDCGDWSIGRLSTGERQRLALVRALMLNSRVLLLDEPTSGLDGDATAAVEAVIRRRLIDGTCAIWITHDQAQAKRVGSRVFVMNGGQIEERPV
jgi:putative ABC transport system ATP-binding protein